MVCVLSENNPQSYWDFGKFGSIPEKSVDSYSVSILAAFKNLLLKDRARNSHFQLTEGSEGQLLLDPDFNSGEDQVF